jgi:hypothetical protein
MEHGVQVQISPAQTTRRCQNVVELRKEAVSYIIDVVRMIIVRVAFGGNTSSQSRKVFQIQATDTFVNTNTICCKGMVKFSSKLVNRARS